MRAMCAGLGLLLLAGSTGCVALMPNIRDRHPSGHPKAVALVPECANVSLKTWAACDVAAEMLEAGTPGGATVAFLVHWEQAAFGDAERARQDASARYDAMGSIVQGKVVADSLDATARIALPVLRKLYENSGDAYSRVMRINADLITRASLGSRSAMDAFRSAHVNAMMAVPAS